VLSNSNMARIIAVLTVLFTLLLSPVIIKGAAFSIGAAVIILCSSVRTRFSGDCQSCSSEFYPITVVVVTFTLFIVLPLTILLVYVGRRRKGLLSAFLNRGV
jgi:hypothetical protein